MKQNFTADTAGADAVRVSDAGIVCNAGLFVFKLAAGILANSGALISDAIHSASDVVSTVFLLFGIKLAARPADKAHPYGHERFECIAAVILSFCLCVTGLFIGYIAVTKPTENAEPVGTAALIAAALSAGVKEFMFRYTRRHARRIGSPALEAGAAHHRSDAVASLGALAGAAGAKMGYVWPDIAARLFICCFILKSAADIFRETTEKLVDHACAPEIAEAILDTAKAVPGVMDAGELRTREFGSRICAELELRLGGDLPLSRCTAVADSVCAAVYKNLPQVKQLGIKFLSS